MINKVTLLGYLGKDPECSNLENGTKFTHFSIATTESYKDQHGEKKTVTEWHHCEAWRGIAETVSKYLKKGSPVLVEGRLKTEKWEEPKTGFKRSLTKVVVTSLTLLPKNEDNSKNPTADLIEYIKQLPTETLSSFKQGFIEFRKKKVLDIAKKEVPGAKNDLPF
ncbi:MAG: single-stranded DNA-binding protein [Flammeovirgaceae bacterium]|nr:single-stranded DNA-binding protein [Flammeovirgaceae bacterium]